MSEASDPKRLADGPASSELGRLMASAQKDLPSEAQLAGLAERLGSVLGPAPAAAPVAHAALRGYSLLAKLSVAIGVAALIAGGWFAARKQPGQATPASVLPAAAVASAAHAPDGKSSASAQALPSAPEVASAASSSAARGASLATGKAAAEPSKAGARAPAGPSEPALLEQARRVLASDPSAALALTNQDAALYPHGVLAQEREVIAIEALRRLKRTAEADRRAGAFGKAFPGSAHQRVVEDAATK